MPDSRIPGSDQPAVADSEQEEDACDSGAVLDNEQEVEEEEEIQEKEQENQPDAEPR